MVAAFHQQVIDEAAGLSEKIVKLASFLAKGAPHASDLQRGMLRRQRNAMLEYHDILVERIKDLEKVE